MVSSFAYNKLKIISMPSRSNRVWLGITCNLTVNHLTYPLLAAISISLCCPRARGRVEQYGKAKLEYEVIYCSPRPQGLVPTVCLYRLSYLPIDLNVLLLI